MPDSHSRPVSVDGLVDENTHAIHQLAELLVAMPEALYRQTFGSGKQHIIGKHVRHIIDHYMSLIRAMNGTPPAHLNYENRQREDILERDKTAARRRLLIISEALSQLAHTPPNTPLKMEHVSDEQQGTIVTTVDRELVFLASHTIHHMAIVAMLAELAGLAVPDGFGVHPSTLRHQQQLQVPMAKSA